jgi:hypothetical protein
MTVPIETVRTTYGYRSTMIDPTTPEEGLRWVQELTEAIAGRTAFSQLVDLRQAVHQRGAEELAGISQVMRFVRERGLLRSAVVVADEFTALKIKQLAFDSGVYEWERYIDGSLPDWQERALDWVVHAIDPDRRA